MNAQTPKQLAGLITKIILLLGWLASSTLADARPTQSIAQSIESNPLEAIEPDPLLPNPPQNGQLASPERERLAAALDRLNQEAMTQLAGGNSPGAFTIWHRELRLRRYLGSIEELAALSRVGAIAWQQEEITQLQIITRRLENLEIEYCHGENDSQNYCNLEFLSGLATGYETVKARDLAIAVYQKILVEAQNRQDLETAKTLLTKIASLSLEQLDYHGAAQAYEQLLAIAETQDDRGQEIAYVEKLTYIYSSGRQLERAIAMRQRLVEFYTNTQNLRLIPELKLAIARDYETLNRLELALNNYQASYNLAWTLQQFYLAREALVQIASIYQQIPELEKALQVYEALLIVDRRSTNLYGLMTTYMQLGQLHQNRENYPQAIAAFKTGLELSQQLKSNEYAANFQQQIEQLNQR